VNEQVYQDILTEIKRKRALIILIVDLLDIPNSISRSWAHLVDQSTENQNTSPNIIFVLGNKVDLLPKGRFVYYFHHTKMIGKIAYICFQNVSKFTNKNFILDSESYLSDVRKCLENECTKRGLGKHIVKYYGLISARTGYGIEQLISKIFRYWSQHGLSSFIFIFT
jgi:ribosome biogenesis GTPase A